MTSPFPLKKAKALSVATGLGLLLCCRQPDGCRIGVTAISVRSQGNKRKGRTTVSGPQPPPHILPARPQRVGAATSQEGGPTERARSGEIFLVVPCYYLDGDRRLIVTLHRPYPLKKLRPFPCHWIGPFAWLPTTTWSTDRRLPPILRRTSGKRGREGDAPPSPSSILPFRCTGHRGPLLDCGLDGQPCGAGKKQRKPGVPCYYLDGDRRVVCRTHRPSLRKEAKGPFRCDRTGPFALEPTTGRQLARRFGGFFWGFRVQSSDRNSHIVTVYCAVYVSMHLVESLAY